jgi:hypothetical protein
MRWSRPGGAPLFVDRPEPKSRGELVWSWLRVLEDASLRTVAEWWFGADATNPRGQKQSPLLPAFAANQRALAILRPDWNAGGDLIGIDHPRGGECRLELVGQGRSWLGPNWPGLSHATGPTALREYSHGPWADLAEWSVRDGAGRAVTRTAILLRGEKAALLAQEHRGVKPGEWVTLRIPLWNGVLPQRVTGSRALELRGSRRAVAHLLPISLPDHDSVIEGGEFKLDGRNVLLRVRARGSRVWLPLFISWDRTRPLNWRVLTITRDTKRIRPDQAFAVRVSRGAGKSLVIYRSLGKPVMRTFLGHQSEARLLLASFDREGELKPLLKLGAEETED